jgi:hypothetical protein
MRLAPWSVRRAKMRCKNKTDIASHEVIILKHTVPTWFGKHFVTSFLDPELDPNSASCKWGYLDPDLLTMKAIPEHCTNQFWLQICCYVPVLGLSCSTLSILFKLIINVLFVCFARSLPNVILGGFGTSSTGGGKPMEITGTHTEWTINQTVEVKY